MFTQTYPDGLRYSLQPAAPVDDFAAFILKHDLLALGDAMQNPEPKYLVTEAWPQTGFGLEEGYRATMVGTRAVALLVGGQNVSENLDRIKGKPDIPDTLRWLLSPARAMSGDEREAYDQLRWERRQKLATSALDPETRDQLLKVVYQEDRIHTTDKGEALVAIRAFFPPDQIAAVAAEHPGVAELLTA
jgi:hypothetical protein